jgi:DNA-binding transcriptional regulator of glucitol operon
MNSITLSHRTLLLVVLVVAAAAAGAFAWRQYGRYRAERDALAQLTPDAKARKVRLAVNKNIS